MLVHHKRSLESAFRELAKTTHADVDESSEEFKRVRDERSEALIRQK